MIVCMVIAGLCVLPAKAASGCIISNDCPLCKIVSVYAYAPWL